MEWNVMVKSKVLSAVGGGVDRIGGWMGDGVE
jgi:hypothetical protein